MVLCSCLHFALLIFMYIACVNGGKIKIVDSPFAFSNPAQGVPVHHGDRGEMPLVARVNPENPSGPPYLMEKLNGRCFTSISNNYKYTFCPFNNVTQREQAYRWNAFHGVLGIWKEWVIVNNTFDSMLFVHGDVCSPTVDRQVQVYLECGNDNEILSITEPSICRYKLKFQTPFACPDDVFQVYPVLSREGQQRWVEIKEMYKKGYLTSKGFQKRTKELYVNEALAVVETSIKDKNINALKKQKIVKEEIHQAANRSTDNSYMGLMNRFSTKSHCVEEYRKLVEERNKLAETLAQLTKNANVSTGKEKNNIKNYTSVIKT